MLWLQAALMFALWVLYGAWQAKGWSRKREALEQMPRPRKAILGPVLMFSGAALMLGGLALVAAFDGMGDAGLKLWAVAALTFVGLVFVHSQLVAALLMVSLASEPETTGRSGAFQNQDSQEKHP